MNWLKKMFGHDDKESIISFLYTTYNRLRENNSDKDEHWFLANTWLARYGDWEESKKKGPKLMKYIAYTNTFQFSLLDNPVSIKILSLYLVSKELGVGEIINEIDEFTDVMESMQAIENSGDSIEIYRQKNPYTWNEIQTEKDESIYSLYGFLNSVDYLNKNPGERERVMEEMKSI